VKRGSRRGRELLLNCMDQDRRAQKAMMSTVKAVPRRCNVLLIALAGRSNRGILRPCIQKAMWTGLGASVFHKQVIAIQI